VKSIGDFAFYHCDNLAAITLLDGVEEIEMAAFSFCPVRAVTIPGSVKNIRIDAFEDCHSLTAVDIDAENIGPYAFSCCSKLVKVVISDKVQSIGKGAFSNCCDNLAAINVGAGNAYYLSEDGVLYDKERKILLRCPCGKQGAFAIPDGVESIAEDAFAYCKGLTAITISGSVKSIGEEAFAGCAKLTVVAIPDDVEHIGKNMFLYCDNLTVVTIPDSVTSIAGGVFGAFENCESLTAIEVGAGNRHYLSEDGVLYNKERTQLLRCPQKKTGIFSIPQGVESIADSAFSRCNDLSTVTIPISVKNIGKRAFSYCAGLTALTIPGSVENIGEWAFNDSHRLTSITMLGVTPPIVEEIDYNLLYHISISTFPPGGREKCTLYVPAGTIKPYRAVSALKYFHIKAIE
jgi:hypothetical protein